MSGSNNSITLHSLLKKTEHYDKDERYMATSDLCDVLKRRAASTANEASTEIMGYQSGQYQSQSHQHSQLIDANMERRICTAVLKLLDDSSNDVQAIAVKTLGVLLTTVHEEQVIAIADRLCSLVLDDSKSDLRDVYAIGIRTLVKTVPLQMGDVVSNRLVARLVEGIRANSLVSSPGNITNEKVSEEISLACLDILIDVLNRFGSVSQTITRQHEQLLCVTLTELSSDRHVIRKRAGTTIGCLSVIISDPLLSRLVESLLSQIDMAEGVGKSGKRKTRQAQSTNDSSLGLTKHSKIADTRALISTMCTVSGSVGHRLGQDQIDRIVPIFLRFCDPDDAIAGDDDDVSDDNADMDCTEEEQDEAAIALANELRESCFAGFHSFILRCPVQIKPHLSQIVHSALAYIRYDPNYSYGDEDCETEVSDEEDEFSEDEYSDEESDEFSDDDDDNSWKVRRSAIRALAAVVEASKQDLSKLWQDEYEWRKGKKKITLVGALVIRFKEREENCRVDVIDCFTNLLSITLAAASNGEVSLAVENSMDTSKDDVHFVIDIQKDFTSSVVKACEKQLGVKKGGERSKSSVFSLLSILCTAPGGIGVSEQIKSLFVNISGILNGGSAVNTGDTGSGSSKSLKLDSLCLVRKILASSEHEYSGVKDALLQVLLSEICHSVEEDWYKLVAEALRVMAVIPRLLLRGNANEVEKDLVAKSLVKAIQPHLTAHDLDQEIKECALFATASLLSNLHSNMSENERVQILSLILQRLKNETTRVVAIKTLATIASETNSKQSSKLDLSPILFETVSVLASLLRQNSRSVKQSALDALNTLILSNGDEDMSIMTVELFDLVLKELGEIIVDSDLHISHLSLDVSISILKVCPSSGASVKDHVLPSTLSLSKSPLLQDMALDSLLLLLRQLVESNAIGFEDLLVELRNGLVNEDDKYSHSTGTKQIVTNLAKCIAVITAATSDEKREAYVRNLVSFLESERGSSSQDCLLALRTSGDIGQLVDLHKFEGVAEKLQIIYLNSFQISSEDLKHAASYALGRASVGSMQFFLPAILRALEDKNQKDQYLLLSSLRELIHCHEQGGVGDIAASIPLILPHLVTHCGDKEEGARTMVAECLGSLVCLQPEVVLPHLEGLVSENVNKFSDAEEKHDNVDFISREALICWTVANSIKFAIAGQVKTQDLLPCMPKFLELLKEDNINVKNCALLMVYSAVHHNPQIVAGLMQELISPCLFELAQMNLQRVVDMGPFKHKVDDALPLRKSALSIFATCLEKCPASLDIPAFMPILAKALDDVEDIQLQAHQIIISMCSRHPMLLVTAVESFVDPLEKTVNKKTGQKSGTELERANEWIKSGLRVSVALSRVDSIMNSRKFTEFNERIHNSAKFKAVLEALEEEI